MANGQPRKFSEKIALHNQKQAEGDAAFQQIMREVTDVTSHSSARNSNKLSLQCSSQSCGGGSLPNVNKISSDTNSSSTVSCLKPARSNLEELHSNGDPVYRERGRSVSGQGGPIRSRAADRRVDTSPYSSVYLSPPSPDHIWRRTSSDSALHQSVQNPNNTLHSPGSQRRATALENQQHYDLQRTRHLSVSSTDKRPRSCEVPNSIPDIKLYPSPQDLGAIQIPIGPNTGSLPDLTNIVFSSPMSTPLDQDDLHSSTYSSGSPQCTSPSTLSPTSLPPRTPGRFSFGSTPPHESSGSPSYASVSPPSPSVSKHLSVPLNNSGYHPRPKGYMTDGSPIEMNGYHMQTFVCQQQQQQQQQQPPMMQQQPQTQSQNRHAQMQPQRPTQYTYQPSSSPQRQSPVSSSDVPCSEQIVLNRNSMTLYRSPQNNHSRSPQSSPVFNTKQFNENTSPLSSAPQSPTSSCNSVNSNNHNNNNQQQQQQQQSYPPNDYYGQDSLQQHFEQIRMFDDPVSSTTADFLLPLLNGPSGSYLQNDDVCGTSNELTVDQGYYSTSPTQLTYGGTMNGAQTTPNTPSSIPDIVLTDCSTNKDFACDIGLSSFLSNDDGLRDDLNQIDLNQLTQDLLSSGDPSSQHLYNSL